MTQTPATMSPLSAAKRALLLRRLKQGASERRPGADAAIPPVSRDRDPELSFAQERLWLADQLAPDRSAYNMPAAVRLSGALEIARLVASLDEVVRRHEALRTTFALVEGRPVQVIHAAAAGSLPVVDLAGLKPAARHRETARLGAREARRPFDLATGPLFRTRLLRLAEEEAVLLLNLHHIVADGWSLAILVRELRALYEAFADGAASPLSELPVQYADFAVWQRERLRGESLENHLAYWRRRLGGNLPDLDLPTDGRRCATHGGAVEHPFRLTPDLARAVSELAREQGTTLFMVLLAALKALLHRLSGQDDLLVGTPMAERGRPEIEGLVGCFLNTLALRTDLGGDPSFRDLLGRVREVALGAFAHREIPFEKLLAELQPQRHAAAPPLFRVFFNLLSFPREEAGAGRLAVELLRPPDVGAKFDLTLYARESAEDIELRWLGDAALWSPARLSEMARQLEQLLRQVAADPEVRLHDLSLVSHAARIVLPDPCRALPCEWAGAVHERFAEQARQHPERIAVADRRRTWSYGALDAASDRLAAELCRRGVGRQEVVAVLGQRSASLAVAVLGVWKSGAAFALLDPAEPARRLADRLRALRPAAWLRLPEAPEAPADVERAVAELVAAERRWTLSGDSAGNAASSATPAVAADDLAYVTFTSGTTGEPKGVLGTHRPLSHFLEWHTASFDLDAGDRFGLLSGLAHDPLLRDLLTPLWLGATLHVPDPDALGIPGRLHRWMQERRITVAHLTPSLGRLLVPRETPAARLAALRLVCFGGETLTRSTLGEIRALAPTARCVNFYGTTETPQAMGCHVIAPGAVPDAVPLGHGIDGVHLLVLGRRGRRAGVGELGEICVRSPYLARGYLADEGLTRERFIVNPYREEAADRLYRTGDLGRFRPDGGVDYAGRADAQIQIRGFRVELGEIETVLGGHPAVLWAAVRHREEGGEACLAAYVVLAGEPRADSGDLRCWLRERLPAHMVPATFTVLPSLPLTANGKVDRGALPEPEGPADAGSYVAPRGPEEELMAGIWQDVLGVDRVGVHDDFFALGGHSLLATQACSRIRDVFGVEIPLRSFFESPALTALCRTVAAAGEDSRVAPPLTRIRREHPLPLSFAQQRLWFLDRLQPGGAVHNLAGAVRLDGRLRPGVLARSLSEIVRRHEALRTTFDYRDGKPVQVIAAAGDVALPEIDLSRVDGGRRRQELERRMAAAARLPFSLAHGPLLRALLLRLATGEHVLVLTLHHIVGDGWSMGVLIRELAALYEAFAAGAPSPLAAPAVQYADFAHWQRSWLRGEALERQLAYWRGQLAGLAPQELPTDRHRPAVQTWRGARRTAVLGKNLAERLRALGRRHGATLYMTLLGAFQTLLAGVTGQRDVAVGSPVAQRTRTEIEGLIGFFVNTLVLRTDLAGDPSFAELLERVRRTTLDAYAHQDLPFEKLVEELDPHRDLSQSPLFQVMFILQNVPRAAIELSDLTVRPLSVPRQAAQFDWTLLVDEADDDLVATLEYNTALFAGTTAERLLRHYRTLLRAIVEAPEKRLSELVWLGAGERHQLREWNDSRAPFTAACLHELVSRQAAATPDAVAVAAGDACLSYRELDRRSDLLARLLRARGVGREARVGLCVRRSQEMVVALLGILKAGGAYVPLDPTYPRERLLLTVRDAGIQVLLSESAWSELLPASDWQTLALDRLAPAPAEPEDEALQVATAPDRLAYVIYTSGSTGRPKGVQISHRTLVNFLESMRRRPGIAAGERLLAVTSLAFDIAGLELFLPLLAGATVVVAGRELAADGVRLARELKRREIRLLQATPATWRLLVRSGWPGRRPLRMLSGGEALPRDLADELLARGASLWNLYGPTETTVWSTLHRVRSGAGPLSIGRPIANTDVRLADRRLRPAAAGATGELMIGGQGLARGYHARSALSAERFVPDPFAAEPGARLYRTGDLARYRPDGRLEFLGRADHQVKVRGHRIELGEIETALAAHPAVAETVVVAARGQLDDDRLVAYWVPAGEAAANVGELRDFLRKSLPDPMVPSAFVELAALPLTPNGKIDRRGLPEPTSLRPTLGAAYVPPRNAVQELIAGIWREVLALDRVGIHDNFFDAGGHSLLMIEVQRRLGHALDREIPVIELFRYPTIDLLAGHLDGPETRPIAAGEGRARALARQAAGGRHTRARQQRLNAPTRAKVTA